MEDVDSFYAKAFGKDSSLFIGTLWLGMIAKHMDEVRKSEDEAYLSDPIHRCENILKWLNKLRTLYDNVEFKTYIPTYKEKIVFSNWIFNPILNKYEKKSVNIEKKDKFVTWFEQVRMQIEMIWNIERNDQNNRLIYNKEHLIIMEIGELQREFYKEIEKKHLIMPPEKESMKELAKNNWIDRGEQWQKMNGQ